MLSGAAVAVLAAAAAFADDPNSAPRPVPLTRPEMKQLLEDMKSRKPRIPLPELTEEEKARLGERGGGYEGRLRALYLPAGEGRAGGGGGGSREPDPNMTLDYPFKTMLFWIVSRTNNCQYCLGHQEWKLAATGMKEEEVAALDGDWSEFTPAQRAAFALARKVTYEPHRLRDADLDALRPHYKDLQILEMIFSVAGNNSTNRWKEGVGVPQSQEGGNFLRRAENPLPADRQAAFKSFLTPTPEQYKTRLSKVAPLRHDEKAGGPSRLAVCDRPPLESREEVEKALAACRKRTPRLPLVEEAKAREVLGESAPKGPLPQWVRLLANFPRDGKARVAGLRSADEKGDLTPLLKAQVSWIVARQDRAWYAAGLAKRRLRELGQTEEQVYQLDGDWSAFSPADRALFTVARKLAATPIVLTDEDVAAALKLTGPRAVVQAITYTTGRAFFDRVTEAAGLQLEE
jgi:alkylhydroperoxidase family enzyme